MINREIKELHGDHKKWSIKLWRAERAAGKTALDYIDWRADKLWCEAADALAK